MPVVTRAYTTACVVTSLAVVSTISLCFNRIDDSEASLLDHNSTDVLRSLPKLVSCCSLDFHESIFFIFHHFKTKKFFFKKMTY